jgi:hypothetical protein
MMIRIAIVLALAAAGCASSAKIERGANAHFAEADRLDAAGDHYHAALERSAGEKQLDKANRRAYQESVHGVYIY